MRTIWLATIFTLSLGLGVAFADDDPFANVGAGAAQAQAPDGSSSVRAKKKASPEMFQGQVEAVTKDDKAFPRVTKVRIKITKAPTSQAAPHNEIKAGTSIEFTLSYKEKGGKIDFSDADTRENIGAFYLEEKDRVEGIVKDKKGDGYELQVLQRK